MLSVICIFSSEKFLLNMANSVSVFGSNFSVLKSLKINVKIKFHGPVEFYSTSLRYMKIFAELALYL